jgi:hypothetical protein
MMGSDSHGGEVMTNQVKEFDAVELMREVREQLSLRYWQHSDLLKQDMDDIRKKYCQDASGNHQPFDYTEWRQNLFDGVPLDVFLENARQHGESLEQ